MMKRVCVFSGSSVGVKAEYRAAAEELGRVLANRQLGLVYGGARIGLMGVMADTALAGHGEVIGVIPAALAEREVAHDRLSELRIVASMHERKATMADLSDGFIAAPGGWGTFEEFFEILTWAQLGLHEKPCGVLNVAGYFDRMLSMVDYAIQEGFLRAEHGSMILVSSSPGELLDMMAAYRPPHLRKWIDRVAP